MSTLATRLREARLEKNMSQFVLADRSGVSQSTIANIEGGRNEGSKHILKIADALNLNANWLMDGVPPKFKYAVTTREAHEIEVKGARTGKWARAFDTGAHRVWLDSFEFEYDPLARNVAWKVAKSDLMPFDEDVFSAVGSIQTDCKLWIVPDDCMEPYLFPHDIVMIDTAKTAPLEAKIYVVLFEGEALVRQVFKQAGGALVLHAFNAKYPDKFIPPDQSDSLVIIGACVYRAGIGLGN